MTTHPSGTVLALYREGTLKVSELLAVDDHIASCPDCRRAVSSGADAGTALRRFVEALGSEHLSYERMERRIDGDGAPEEDALVDEHAAICEGCAEEVADLDEFVRPLPRLQPWRWLAIASAAAAAGVIIAIVAFPDGQEVEAPRHAAAKGAKAAAPNSPVQHGGSVTKRPAVVPSAPPADETLQSLDPSLRRVADALQSGTLVSAELLASLHRKPEQQRAAGGHEGGEIRVTHPVGIVVETDRPSFRWTRTAERSVTVRIFDRDYTMVAESPRVDGTSWQTPSPLPRGATYRWQLSVHQEDGHDTVAPAPPAPPALFHVVGSQSFEELAKARASGSSLEVGLIYVREGLLAEGSRTLSRYADQHPQSAVAARLAERARAAAQSAPIATNGAQ